MANISAELAAIMAAVYGEDVRGSIHDAIEKINDVSEVVISAGTAVTSPTSSSAGFYDESLYVNTNTFDLWQCVGTNTWNLLGNLKGADGATGNGIDSITKTSTSGLVDTYTITYDDGNTDTFNVTNGANGNDGADGVSVTGVSLLSKVGLLATYRMSFSNGSHFDYTVSDGASGSGTGDMTKAVYDTDNDGIVDAAETLQGLTATIADLNKTASLATVATSGSYADLSNKPTIPTVNQTYSGTSTNAQSGVAVKQAIDALDNSDSAVSGQYVSAVSEANGIITVSRASLPTIPTVNSGHLTLTKGGTNYNYYADQTTTNVTVDLDCWTSEITLAAGDTSKTFTGLNANYGYEPYVQVADGETPPTLTSVVASGTSLTVTFSEITSAQAAGSAAKLKLRILK